MLKISYLKLLLTKKNLQTNQVSGMLISLYQFSRYIQELKIIFNPLNFFRIISIKCKTGENGEFFQIQLKLINSFRSCQKNKSQFQSADSKLHDMLILRQQDDKAVSKLQGSCFIHDGKILKERWLHSSKFLQISELQFTSISQAKCLSKRSQIQRNYLLGLVYMAYLLQINDDSCKAHKLCIKAQRVLNQKLDQNDLLFKYKIFGMLASYYQNIFDTEKSLELLLKCKSILDKYYDPDNKYMAFVLKKIGLILLQKKELESGLIFFQQSIKIQQKIFGCNNFYDQLTSFGVGQYFRKKKNFTKAIQFFKKSLAIIRRLYGQGIFYAKILELLAQSYLQKGDFRIFIEITQAILVIKQACYGYDHLSVAQTLVIAASAYSSQGLDSNAIQCYEKSNQILRKYGQYELGLALNYLCIGKIYFRNDQPDKAQAFYEKAKQIAIRAGSQNNQTYTACLKELGRLYSHQKQYDKALKILQTAKRITKKQLWKQSYAECLYYIGCVYAAKMHKADALRLFKKSLEIKQSIYGPVHFVNYPDLVQIANLELNQRNFLRALSYLREAEATIAKFYGPVHPLSAWISAKFAQVFEAKGNLIKSLDFLIKSLKISQKLPRVSFSVYMQKLEVLGSRFKGMGCCCFALRIYKYIFKQLDQKEVKAFEGSQIILDIAEIYLESANSQAALKFIIKNKDYFTQNPISKKKRKILIKLAKKCQNKQYDGRSFADF